MTVRHKAELRAKQCLGLYWACRVSRLARTLGGCLEEETKVRKANLTHISVDAGGAQMSAAVPTMYVSSTSRWSTVGQLLV